MRTGETLIGKVQAVDVVGEMGFITGMLRSATLEVEQGARLIAIAKDDFDRLLDEDDHMAAIVYRRFVDVLCYQLRETNNQQMQILAV